MVQLGSVMQYVLHLPIEGMLVKLFAGFFVESPPEGTVGRRRRELLLEPIYRVRFSELV